MYLHLIDFNRNHFALINNLNGMKDMEKFPMNMYQS